MKIKCNTRFTLDRRSDKDGNPIVHNLPINMDFTFSGKRLRFFTGYRIDADKWIDTKKEDPETGEVIHVQQVKKNAYNKSGESYGEINKRLLLLKTTITKIYEESVILGKAITVDYLREELRRALNEEKNPTEELPMDFFSVLPRVGSKSIGRTLLPIPPTTRRTRIYRTRKSPGKSVAIRRSKSFAGFGLSSIGPLCLKTEGSSRSTRFTLSLCRRSNTGGRSTLPRGRGTTCTRPRSIIPGWPGYGISLSFNA